MTTSQRTTVRQPGWQSTLFWVLNNGPAIVTVVGSAALAVAASVVQLSELQILKAVLALLALIGTSLLTERIVEGRGLRNRLSEIDGRLEEVLAYARDIETVGLDSLVIRRRDLPPLEERLDGAKGVAISGGSLFRLVNEYQNLFEQLAASGCGLRFLMTDPDADAVEVLSSAVVYESNDVGTYRTQMRAALAGLTSLAARYPTACQVKLCTIAPPFSIMVVDRGHDSSTIQVELYPFRLPARNRPMLLLDRQHDPKLHAIFSSQFEDLWRSEFCRAADASAPHPKADLRRESRREDLTKTST